MGLLSAYLTLAVHSSWLWLALLLVSLYWAYMRLLCAYYDSNIERNDDKTFLITGAESGIGKSSVDLIASRGGRIIMACKDIVLGQAVRDQIAARRGNNKLEVHQLDLSSLESVRQFSRNIHNSVDHLDVLVNNAAINNSLQPTTTDGLNTVMQVNHFGPFLLTNLLLDLLKKSTPSRIVFVSTVNHHFHKFSLDNLNCEKEALASCRLYFTSKLANILTAKYFARILKGTGVTVNSLHPGMVKTDLSAKNCTRSFPGNICNMWIDLFGRTPTEGAMTVAYAATEPNLKHVTGEHFAECKVSRCVAKIAYDRNLQDRLFEKSAQLVQLRPEEKHI